MFKESIISVNYKLLNVKIDLSGNNITTLPDLSSFTSLKFIDLTNNPIDVSY